MYIQIRPWIWSFWSGWDTNICSDVPTYAPCCWNIYQHLLWKSPSFVGKYTIHGYIWSIWVISIPYLGLPYFGGPAMKTSVFPLISQYFWGTPGVGHGATTSIFARRWDVGDLSNKHGGTTGIYHLVIWHSHGKWPLYRWFTYENGDFPWLC